MYVNCPTCRGRGKLETECNPCGGSGRRSDGTRCQHCAGLGRKDYPCPNCDRGKIWK